MSEQLIHPTPVQIERIRESRQEFNGHFNGDIPGHVLIVGPCSITNDEQTISNDGIKLADFSVILGQAMLLRRLNPWKPRTNLNDWHGLETSNLDAVRRILEEAVLYNDNVTFELGKTEHFDRYDNVLSFAWAGSRNSNELDFLNGFITSDCSLPVGLKNGLSGDVDALLKMANALRQLRSPDDAVLVPIFRGGTSMLNRKDWSEGFKRMSGKTNGQFIVDVAHGSEMAHHPGHEFEKTIIGQRIALEHVIDLNVQGHRSVGIMVEASDLISPTDPNIPLDEALNLLAKFI